MLSTDLDLDSLTLTEGAHPARDDVSPVIAAFARSWNDDLNDDDRNRLLKPLIPRLIGTRTTDEDEETRAWLATDWLVRVHTPAWLRLAGLEEHARALESLERIVDTATARSARPTLKAARKASAAARDGASTTAWAAAWDAAWAAARDARDAATDRLAPTVAELQESAVDLLLRMCAVGRVDA